MCIIIIFIHTYDNSGGSIILYSSRDYNFKYVPIISCVCDDVFFVLCSYVICTFLDNYVLMCSLLVSSDWAALIYRLPLIFSSQYGTNEGGYESSNLHENEMHVKRQHSVVVTGCNHGLLGSCSI